jgi:hypothetical protein
MGVPRDLGVAVSGIAPTRQFIQHDIPVYGLKRKALTNLPIVNQIIKSIVILK